MTTHDHPSTPATAPNAAEAMLAHMQLLGLSLDDLANAMNGNDSNTVTVAAFVKHHVIPATTTASLKVWRPYLHLLTDGYEGLCSCMCARCLESFNGASHWVPCHCVQAGHCDCSPATLSAGAATTTSCLDHCSGVGAQSLAALRSSDLQRLAGWAQLRAQKRVAVRNKRRSEKGRPTHAHDGRSAAEQFRAATSAVYRRALSDDVAGITRNRALDITVKARPKPKARAYTTDQLEQLWNSVFTSGSNDTELDMLIVWFCLETGSRRGGLPSLTVGDLLFASSRVRLGEKNDKVDEQPVSQALLAALLSHAVRRGHVVATNDHAVNADEVTVEAVIDGRVRLRTDRPVFYYRRTQTLKRPETQPDGTVIKVPVLDDDGDVVRVPWPMTAKRFETLWARLRRELGWLDEMHGRPHDLRKTMGTFIERAHGHAVAQGWLRHTVQDVTGIYTVAGSDEISAAHDWLTGKT